MINDKRPLTIRCDAEILEKCRAIGKLSRRSLNSQIEEFLEKGIREFEEINGTVFVEIPEE